MQTNREKYT